MKELAVAKFYSCYLEKENTSHASFDVPYCYQILVKERKLAKLTESDNIDGKANANIFWFFSRHNSHHLFRVF